MRVIRTIDPLSGKVMQKKITLSSTSGVNTTQHEELPENDISDVVIASNQLTRAVYDVRDTMRETNVINYEISRKLKKGIDSTSEVINAGYQANVDALHGIKDEINDFKNTDSAITSAATQEITSSISQKKLDVDVSGIESSVDSVNSSVNSVKLAIHNTNTILEEISNQDRMSADNMTVSIGAQTMTINQAFIEIFSLLNEMNEKLSLLNNEE